MPAKNEEDLQTLQADVASFASSLGLSSSFAPASDFDHLQPSLPAKIKHADRKRKLAASEPLGAKKREVNGTSLTVGDQHVKRKVRFLNDSKEGASVGSQQELPAHSSSKTFSRLWSLLKSRPWYEATAALLSTGDAYQTPAVHSKQGSLINDNNTEDRSKLVTELRKKGEDLMEKAAADYEKHRGKDSDMRWLMIARRTGTTADRVAAFTVLIQDNPVANLKALDALLGMVTSKGGKRHAGTGIDALKELFVTTLLPDRKLKYFAQQPLQAQREGDRLLLLWYWEDCLKHRYEEFVDSLDEAAKDRLPFLKEKAVKTIYELLKSKPEQERRLLSALVNKLGDPERKVASNAGYFLSCLLTTHPNMKMVVVEEVDSFLFRPHLGLRSKYQAVVFLNQMVMSNRGDGPDLAKRLIDIYFSLFKVISAGDLKDGHIQEKKGRNGARQKGDRHKNEDADTDTVFEIDSRILSALLTGVNRAFPFVAVDEVDILIEEHTPILFRLVHSKSFNVGIQALMLLYQLLAKNQTVSDRFYRALYAVLFSPELAKSSKVEMFLGLLFKAVKSDINSKRMAAFAKRLMQVALQQAPQFACGCLLLLSEVLKSRSTLWSAVTQPEDGDEDTEQFHDIMEESPVQNATCDAIKEPMREVWHDSSESDEELHAMVPDLGDEDESSSADEGEYRHKTKKVSGGMLKDNPRVTMAGNMQAGSPSKLVIYKDKWPRTGYYHSRHREPSFCCADQACWWELTALASHVHPSVATMAKTLLSGASIIYEGDPLRDLALGVFLDRFAEKKPKPRKGGNWHGSSLSVPARKASSTSIPLPVGMEFLQLSEREVAPEDVVFHRFYTSKSGKKKGKVGKKEAQIKDEITTVGEGEDDLLGADDSDDDEVEDLLDQDEGMEMGLDEFSEEDSESDENFTYKDTVKQLKNRRQQSSSVFRDAEEF